MKTQLLAWSLALALPAAGAVPANAESPALLAQPTIDTVRPRIDFFASASIPYGMVALHPDTHQGSQLWDSGYRWGDDHILMFTHSHMVQTPGISLMPVVGPREGRLDVAANRSRFSHEQETIRPGYHQVKLLDSGITAEMTATCRVGLSRYTFPASETAHVLFYLSAQLADVKVSRAFAQRLGPTRLAGYSVLAPTSRRRKPTCLYFVADFQRPFDHFAGWQTVASNGVPQITLDPDKIEGRDIGAHVTFQNVKAGEQIMVKVALSYVSLEGAAKNLDAEMPGWDFDAVARSATQQWNDYLGRIEVEGGTREQRVKFYTDLMHTAIGRRVYSDADGTYLDRGGREPVVRTIPRDAAGKPSWQAIDMDCLWGTHWNLNILWTLAYPDYGNWVAQTLLHYFRNNGILGRGQWGGHENFTMVGDTSLPLLAALANNRQARFDLEEAYAAARKNAFPGGVRDHAGYDQTGAGGGMDWYTTLGYVPVEIKQRGAGLHREGSGMTLEYAYQDWCLGRLAEQLGKTQDADLFTQRSENWRHVFDTSVGWARPRQASGAWVEPFRPVNNRRGFIESTPAVASYYVPHNLPGLITAMGGRDAFIKKLDAAFETSRSRQFRALTGYVDYSNQPGCAMAHLFSYAGAPWKTQYWVRQVKELTFGGTTPQSGYHGDEDEGQMGALGVLMAIGLFNVQGCVGADPQLEITSPLFDRIVIHLPRGTDTSPGRTFQIRVKRRDADKDIYIQSVLLNGKPWTRFHFPVRALLDGGVMEIELGPEPQPAWGVEK